MKKVIFIMKKNEYGKYSEKEGDFYEKDGFFNIDILTEKNGKKKVKTLKFK